jgi:hypothetical protein
MVILASCALIPISFITFLMILAGSYGTESTTVLGFLSVVVAPPVTLVAGIALLRRNAWARPYLIALFGLILVYNVYAFSRADPEPSHYVSPSGVRTTVLGTDRTIFVPMILACIGALAILLSRRAHLELASSLKAPGSKQRDEIVARIKSELREPDDDSSSAGGVPVSVAAARAAPGSSHRLGALLAVALLLALATGMAWLVYDGVGSGETIFPSKSTTQRRAVFRADEPMLFWVSIGLYALVGLGCVSIVGWGLVQARRPTEGRPPEL